MANIRAPKQWALTKQETITSFEAWRQNLQHILSLDKNFAAFLVDGVIWEKKTVITPKRGFVSDGEDVAERSRRTDDQKVTHLELMLGQIANYCPVISRNTIVKNSTSLSQIWQTIRLHYGFQLTGSHFLDFNSISLNPDERPEDLYQRLISFIEDNLLTTAGRIAHHGTIPTSDEELTPSLENIVVLTWLRLIHPDLPQLVKQRYGTELRSQTLASLRPEISLALDSLLDEIHTSADAKIFRTATNKSTETRSQSSRPLTKICPAKEFVIPRDILDDLITTDGAFQYINDTYNLEIFPVPIRSATGRALYSKFEEIHDLKLYHPNPMAVFRVGPNPDRNRMMCWLKAFWVFYEYLRKEKNYNIQWANVPSVWTQQTLKSIDIIVNSISLGKLYRISFYVKTGTVLTQGGRFQDYAEDHFPCVQYLFKKIHEDVDVLAGVLDRANLDDE